MTHFPTHAVLSACTGKLMGDIGDLYKVMSYMLGRDAYTHELSHYGKQAAAALRHAHPELPGDADFDHVDRDNVLDVRAEWETKLGVTLDLDASLSKCLADDKTALETLNEIAPGKPVIVIGQSG